MVTLLVKSVVLHFWLQDNLHDLHWGTNMVDTDLCPGIFWRWYKICHTYVHQDAIGGGRHNLPLRTTYPYLPYFWGTKVHSFTGKNIKLYKQINTMLVIVTFAWQKVPKKFSDFWPIIERAGHVGPPCGVRWAAHSVVEKNLQKKILFN